MMLTRLAVGLEPLNALDAAHRSPQSALHFAKQTFGSPAGPATRRPIKRNKELAKESHFVLDIVNTKTVSTPPNFPFDAV